MKISQTLRKPKNWQDFESLCLLLWREEWKSEDIKKNGRNGQAQKGVDICGHRENEDGYSGIQCKCKPGNKPITADEIDSEIENAKQFQPALRRLIFATTADKDVTIEEYVRIKDNESRKAGSFTIDIKSWQDIVDMLERNRSVLYTYMDIVADDYAVSVSFVDGGSEAVIAPQHSRIYYMEPTPHREDNVLSNSRGADAHATVGSWFEQMQRINDFAERFQRPQAVAAKIVRGSIETNYSYYPLKFMMANQGKSPIDDFKLAFHFDNKTVSFVTSNVKKKEFMPTLSYSHLRTNVQLIDGEGVVMFGNSLIPGDSDCTDDFYVKVPAGVNEVMIHWRLLSRHYSTEGDLRLIVEHQIVDNIQVSREKAGQTEMTDCIEKVDIE